MKRKHIFIGVILLFLVSLVFAANTPEPWLNIFDANGQQYKDIVILVSVALLYETLILSLLWASATFFNHDRLRAGAKLAVFEVVYSAILFLLVFSLFPIFDSTLAGTVPSAYTPNTIQIVNKLTNPGAGVTPTGYEQLPVHFRYAKFFLQSLFNEATKFNLEVFSEYAWTGVAGDIYLSLDLFWEQRSFITYNPLKGFFNMGNIVKLQVFDLVAKVALISKFQEIFLHVFITGFFPIFLSAGTILRAFDFTRRLGGLMMAIAVALYFIFPLCYVFAGAVYDHTGGIGSFHIDKTAVENLINPYGSSVQNSIVSTDIPKDDLGQPIYGNPKDLEKNTFETMSTEDVCSLLGGTDANSETDAKYLQSGVEQWYKLFQTDALDVAFVSDAYFEKPGRLIFFSMFFSFFGLMTTVASIRSLSEVFGGDMEIAGLTHLI